jgi:hypothetical protein
MFASPVTYVLLSTFGSYNANGATRTFYKPDPSKHEYETNWDYWQSQSGYLPWSLR